MRRLNLDEEWLLTEIRKRGLNGAEDLLFASLDTDGELFVSEKERSQKNLPPNYLAAGLAFGRRIGVLQKPLIFARELICNSLKAGGCAVDATCGNGHDTVFLAERVGKDGLVLAFDIQPQAVAATQQRLIAKGLLERVRVIEASHAEMADYSQATFDAVMFNLGYLPHGDHRIITKPESTVAALSFATKQLNQGGIITMLFYTGHYGGMEEWNKVEEFVSVLPQQLFTVLEYRLINQKNNPPFLLAITRL